jgi:hypothetical protein
MKKILTATLILNALIQAAATADAAPVTRRRLAQQAAPTAPAAAVADPLAEDPLEDDVAVSTSRQRAGVIPSSASNAAPQMTAASTSVTTAAPAAPAKRIKVTFGYDGATSGLRNLKSAESPSDFTATGGGPLEHRFFVAVPYKLAEKVSITPQVGVLVTGRAGDKPPQQVLDVPFVTLKVKDVIKTKNYSLEGAFRTYFGVTNAMHDRGRMASFRYTAAQSVSIPDTKFSLGLEAFLQGQLYRETYADQQRIRRYLNPTISYQATEATSVSLSFEQRATNLMGDATMFTYAEESQNFQAVVNSNLTPNLNLNTGLDFKPHGRINMDTTQLTATLVWTVN